MKKILLIPLIALSLVACSDNQTQDTSEIEPNYIGKYTDHYVNIFAEVVNGNTRRQVTGEVFSTYFLPQEDLAVEVYPGSTYEPDLIFPKLPEGYYAEILFEEVNRHAEKPKELFSGTATSSNEGIVDIPNKPGAYFRYTMKVFDKNGEFKDVYYMPLFTTFADYNFVFNVRKPVYDQDEKITLNIENWGPNYVSFNKDDWKLFKEKNDEWEIVDNFLIEDKEIIDGPLIIQAEWRKQLQIDSDSELLGSGDNESINLNHNKLEKGFYKIQGKMGSANHVFTVEDSFEVK